MKLSKRKSPRKRGYDYSDAGEYFVTIKIKNNEPYFGNIKNGFMCLNDVGTICWDCRFNIPRNYSFVILHEFIVMPDHVHMLIGLKNEHVGTPFMASVNEGSFNGFDGNYSGSNTIDLIDSDTINRVPTTGLGLKGDPMKNNKSLGFIIRYFKGKCSYLIRKNCDINFKWQGRYHDRIVRTEFEHYFIEQYILDNPKYRKY